MNYSLTFTGVLTMILGWLIKELNLDITPESLETTIATILTIGGAVVAFYGRWRKGDVSLFGWKLK